MKNVTIYTKNYCSFCKMACSLLKSKGVDFKEIDVTHDEDTFSEVKKKTGSRTVPQIFIEDEFIGGFDNLTELVSSGELENKLQKN